jgi:hypothetical protein
MRRLAGGLDWNGTALEQGSSEERKRKGKAE